MCFLTQFENSLMLLLIILEENDQEKKLPLSPAALWYNSFIWDTYLLRIFCHVGRFLAPETLHYIPLDDCAIYWNNSMGCTIMRRKPKGGNKKSQFNWSQHVLILYTNRSEYEEPDKIKD